uniref:DUF6883 domain-containing protein n=1 Tax=Candidatus Kentrum sp. LFY TaxID=2126342 RepID=A0A450WEJ4_9GAMM|nr:MAG: hypothetical protein BECKLFY1418C_GA0070996_101523 [Candidatus Kentron sp. LFY]
MGLSNRENAWIPTAKITEYLLLVTHPAGKSKAPFFLAHGYHPGNSKILEHDLLKVARTGRIIESTHSPYGEKYASEALPQTDKA